MITVKLACFNCCASVVTNCTGEGLLTRNIMLPRLCKRAVDYYLVTKLLVIIKEQAIPEILIMSGY